MNDMKAIFELLVDMKSEMNDMKTEMQEIKKDMRSEIKNIRDEMEQRFDALTDDMNHRFDRVDQEIYKLRMSVDTAYSQIATTTEELHTMKVGRKID